MNHKMPVISSAHLCGQGKGSHLLQSHQRKSVTKTNQVLRKLEEVCSQFQWMIKSRSHKNDLLPLSIKLASSRKYKGSLKDKFKRSHYLMKFSRQTLQRSFIIKKLKIKIGNASVLTHPSTRKLKLKTDGSLEGN